MLNEDIVIAEVIAIKAIANKLEKNFGTSTGFKTLASVFVLQCSR